MKSSRKKTHLILFFVIFIMLLLVNITPVYGYRVQENLKKDMIAKSNSDPFPDRQFVNRLLKIAHMPGFAVGIINQDGSVDYHMFGEKNRKTGEPPTKDTVFFAASLTKTVTAAAIMQLWEQGKIDLDEDINTYLPFDLRHPNYPNTPITVRMLLTHTAGFTNILWRTFLLFSFFHFPLDWYEYYLTPGNRYYRADNWYDFKPGEGIYYTSLGYDLLGYIVEVVSGEPFPEYCKQHIFEPLQMYNTTMLLKEVDFNQLATLHIHLLGIFLPIPYYEIHDDGSGGMYTTVEDTSKFLQMQMNKGSYQQTQILKPTTVEQMHTIQTGDLPSYDIYEDSRNYGYGWIVWPDREAPHQPGLQGHLGNTPGGLASMTVLNDTGVIFFGNEWTRVSYQQTGIMFLLRYYFHTKAKPSTYSI